MDLDKENICTELNTAIPTTSAAGVDGTRTTMTTIVPPDIHNSGPVACLTEEEELEREKEELYKGNFTICHQKTDCVLSLPSRKFFDFNTLS